MEITLHPDTAPLEGADALVVLCAPGEGRLAEAPLAALDEATGGHLGRHAERLGFRGRRGQQVLVTTLGRLPVAELALVGAGKADPDPEAWLELGLSVGARAEAGRWRRLALLGAGLTFGAEAAEPLLRGLCLARYQFRGLRTPEPEDPPPGGFEAIHLGGVPEAALEAARAAAAGVPALVEATTLCRDLVNEPPSRCTPRYLADRAAELAAEPGRGLALEVLDREACAALGMGLFLAVAQGSEEPPAFLHLTYRPGGARGPKVALVGKGITFDSGGLSLKTAAGMKDMKNDMAGGATVIAVMSLLARLGLPLEVHGLVPACENMISARAYKLGDVLRGLDGPSVEIVNTDAEGRLVLADGIAFARRLGADLVVDVATLTGACVVALGEPTAGLFGEDDRRAEALLAAARAAGESFWRLPLTAALGDQLKSAVADCKNSGGRYGGAITAALFLQKFAKDTPHLHLDIAGPAFREKGGGGRPAGATGFGVATLARFLSGLAEAGPGKASAPGPDAAPGPGGEPPDGPGAPAVPEPPEKGTAAP